MRASLSKLAQYTRGYDIFTVPACGSEVLGMADCQLGDRRLITLFLPRDGPRWTFVLLHEIAHHELGHTSIWSSTPDWRQEFDADQWALRALDEIYGEEVAFPFREGIKLRFRALLEKWLDSGITQHGELDAAVWAECKIPEHHMEEIYASRWLKMRIREVRPRPKKKPPPPLPRSQINSAADKILAWLERRGEGTAQDIANGTGIPRSTVDNVLDSLRNKFKVNSPAKISGVALWRKTDG